MWESSALRSAGVKDPMWCTRRRLFLSTVLFAVALAAPPDRDAFAQVRPRFVLLVDSSGSMTENASRVRTHGDGSETHPGCDLDGNGKYDDSKLFQAKQALTQT